MRLCGTDRDRIRQDILTSQENLTILVRMDIDQALRNLLGTISETLAPNDASTTTRIQHLTLIRAELDKLTKNEIDAARSFGESWESIGGALGTSKQSAWERYK
jgi:hypothetical protein